MQSIEHDFSSPDHEPQMPRRVSTPQSREVTAAAFITNVDDETKCADKAGVVAAPLNWRVWRDNPGARLAT